MSIFSDPKLYYADFFYRKFFLIRKILFVLKIPLNIIISYLSKNLSYRFFWSIDYFFMKLFLEKINKNSVRRNQFAKQNQLLLGFSHAINSHAILWKRKNILENLLRYKNKQLVFELEYCATKLKSILQQLASSSCPIILAPLHMHSDKFIALITSCAVEGSLSIISDENEGFDLFDDSKVDAPIRIKIHPITPGQLNQNQFFSTLRNVKHQKEWLAVFPDVLPELTLKMFNTKMRTCDISLFDRNARLHSGIFEMSRLTQARVLVYCLTRHKQQFDIDIMGCIDHNLLRKELPKLMEKALQKHYSSWLLWHTPSLFYFND